jgi:hypothetical protein
MPCGGAAMSQFIDLAAEGSSPEADSPQLSIHDSDINFIDDDDSDEDEDIQVRKRKRHETIDEL